MSDAVQIALITASAGAIPPMLTACVWGYAILRQSKKNHEAINGKVSKMLELQDEKMREQMVSSVLTGFESGKHMASEKRAPPPDPKKDKE